MSIEPHEAAQRLPEIRERTAAIIPGPWRWFGNTATDQIYLGTRGRLILLQPSTYSEQRVYNHDAEFGYSLDEARERTEDWCGAHDPDYTDGPSCRCESIRDFLRGDVDAGEGARHLDRPAITRVVLVHPDLRFPEKGRSGDDRDRKERGGSRMRSYREAARFEVLGYRTTVEWEMDQGGVVPSAGGDIKDHLYREDFVGIDTPEADFIQHSAGDVAWLLSYIAELEERINVE